MHIADYVLVILYLILMVVIGFQNRSSSSNLSDYIRMGGKSPWWLAGCSIFMMGFSTITFTGISGSAYLAGWSVLIWFWGNSLALFIQAGYFAPLFRRSRAYTPFDIVKSRFGPVAEQVLVYAGTLPTFFWGGMFLYGLATFCSAVFGIPIWILILVIGSVVVFYSVSGGSWSVQITDSLQAIILLPVTIVFTILCIVKAGGFSGLFEAIESAQLTKDFALLKPSDHHYQNDAKVPSGYFTAAWLSAVFVSSVLRACTLESSFRYLSVKNELGARKAALLAGGLTLAGSIIWFIPPIVGRLYFSEAIEAVQGLNNNADAAYAVTAMNILPPGFVGLIVIAMLAATMSTMDSVLTGVAGQIVRNIIPAARRRLGLATQNEQTQLKTTRFVNLLLGALAICVAFIIHINGGNSGIFDIVMQVNALISPIYLPMALALITKKIAPWGLISGMALGTACSTTFFILTKQDIEVLWHTMYFAIAISSLLPPIISSFFYEKSNARFRANVESFFELISTPIESEELEGEELDGTMLITVGRYVIGVGTIIGLLTLIGESFRDYATSLSVAVFLIALGSIMYAKGKKCPTAQ
ncbi:hypothetical protein MLD52_00495 [Puniceicoccaceae bacterium K14]|nr:hypothetical protein [Puniceicoccaceae bacterium K14]